MRSSTHREQELVSLISQDDDGGDDDDDGDYHHNGDDDHHNHDYVDDAEHANDGDGDDKAPSLMTI